MNTLTTEKEIVLTEMYDAAAFMMIGVKPSRIEFVQAEGKYHFVFVKSAEIENTLTLWNKNLKFLKDETKFVKKRFYEKLEELESNDPLRGVGKVFRETTRRIKGAARKGSDGKWHG